MNPARVFVVQENPKINVLPALRYGSLEPLLSPGEEIVLNPTYVTRRLDALLKNFTDDDFLLPIGNPVAIGIAFALAAKYNRGRVAVLKWDQRERLYYPVKVDLNV